MPEEEYQPLAELAQMTGYASTHLGWLIRQGRLAAVKRGGRWYSTLAAIDRYQADVAAGRFPAGRPRKNVSDNQ